MTTLTEFQQRKLLYFVERLRDKLAIEINQGTVRDPAELQAVCRLLAEVRPVIDPYVSGPPGGMVDSRGNVH